jgi:subtilisin family serine protease
MRDVLNRRSEMENVVGVRGRSAILAVVLLALAAPATAAARVGRGDAYIVQLQAPPLASYQGGKQGLPATDRASTGTRRLSTRSTAARAYRTYLDDSQRRALDRVPGTRPAPFHSYRVAFAGFAARLTHAQAAALRAAPQVAHVWSDLTYHTTAPDPADPNAVDAALGGPKGETPSYLGLPKGLWANLGGADRAGEGVVVGDLDTGITPQHPSFADDPAGGKYVGTPYGPPPASWNGACQTGQAWTVSDCNRKLIGARWYVAGFGLEHLAPDEFVSARDADGHGSHTSATAAGNFGVDPSIAGNTLGVDLISGIAPRARIAEYKVCWTGGDTPDGCANSDTLAAVDDAIADGVDVINYSVGSDDSQLIGAVEYAFLGAYDAGVFVSNSAGNAGPGAGTVGSPAAVPWLTTVAADQMSRSFRATATVTPAAGAPIIRAGDSVTNALPATPLVDAATSGLAAADPADAALCMPDTLDPAKVTGKAVLCVRGVNARVDKSRNVKLAGGVGMVLYNAVDNQDTETDNHWVPSVHLVHADGVAVKAAIAQGPTTVALTAGRTTPLARGAIMAAFSSRGPQTAVPDIPKPDVTAPGVNVLAAASPVPAASLSLRLGELFQSISGTSMAAPQVAGAGALLKQLHPTWNPERIKSALMTTADAGVLAEDGTTQATPFDMGSGEIDPTAAAQPGLVFDTGVNDYIRYVDSQDASIFADDQDPIEPADLNLPSIAAAKVAGTFATARVVTSVDPGTRRWTASLSVPGFTTFVGDAAGFATFSVASGESRTLTIQARRTTAPLRAWSFGTLTLTSGSTVLHVPVSLLPIPISAPARIRVTTDAPTGSQAVSAQAGYAGTLNALGLGLAAVSPHADQTVAATTGSPDPTGADDGTKVYDVDVPAGSKLLSGRISNVDGGDPNTDLDLFVYRDANADGTFAADELVDQSASGIANEVVDEILPAAGRYRFAVVGYTTRGPSHFDFGTWLVDDTSPDDPADVPGISLTGDPFTVSTGQIVAPMLRWSGVLAKGLYLGLATYHDSATPGDADTQATSIVELTKTTDTAPPAPPPPPPAEPPPPPPPPPAVTPPAAPPPPPAPRPAVRPNITNPVVVLRRGTLTLTLGLNRPSSLAIVVRHGATRVLSATRRSVASGRHAIHITVGRRIRKGSYVVSITATAGGRRSVTRHVRLRVR